MNQFEKTKLNGTYTACRDIHISNNTDMRVYYIIYILIAINVLAFMALGYLIHQVLKLGRAFIGEPISTNNEVSINDETN